MPRSQAQPVTGVFSSQLIRYPSFRKRNIQSIQRCPLMMSPRQIAAGSTFADPEDGVCLLRRMEGSLGYPARRTLGRRCRQRSRRRTRQGGRDCAQRRAQGSRARADRCHRPGAAGLQPRAASTLDVAPVESRAKLATVVDVHDIKSVDRERTESSTPRRTRGCDLRPGAEPMTMTTPHTRRNSPPGATAGRDRVRTAPVPRQQLALGGSDRGSPRQVV